ncbi:hypothetical protein GCM10010464_27420 [Pseudonocardia yunnanensis]|uniref:ATP-dependent DNA ligase family profile domain-containing protein n=1 Tax=Pseudonocardia yunnanensis TaxID=58107 RepID=A0ABW4F311_9PSEU
MLRPPVQPMVARSASDLPTTGPWAFEPRLDGFRAIATADRRRVRLHSRQNRPLTRYVIAATLGRSCATPSPASRSHGACHPRELDGAG